MTVLTVAAALTALLLLGATAGPALLGRLAPALSARPRWGMALWASSAVLWALGLLSVGPLLAWTVAGPGLPGPAGAVCRRCLTASNPFASVPWTTQVLPTYLLLLVPAAVVVGLLGYAAVRLIAYRRELRRQLRTLAAVAELRQVQGTAAWVVPSAERTAYALPRRRDGIVLTQGTLDGLDDDQVAAVLAHERRTSAVGTTRSSGLCRCSPGSSPRSRRGSTPVHGGPSCPTSPAPGCGGHDGSGWSDVYQLSDDTTLRADVKAVGGVVHVLLHGGSSKLVSLQYDSGSRSYRPWSARPGSTPVSLPGSETATIDIDGTGRMWLGYDTESSVQVRYADSPYSSFSGPVTLETGITEDDIAVVTAMSGGVGVMWSDQRSDLFGFRFHANGAAPGTWGGDESPGAAYAASAGSGFADATSTSPRRRTARSTRW
ncbi:M48 family metalloprotease [Georgenia sp. SUBG003]|uniref:M48 family metalloprotease n=1 Tax=Georgenia sp. SUBG003 TaxID=1497974 RepID=UPI003AB14B75